MASPKTLTLVVAGALGVAALSACGDDGRRVAGGVDVASLSPSSATGGAAAGAPSASGSGSSAAPGATRVAALRTVTGVLQRDEDGGADADDRYEDFSVNGVDVDFGPSRWVATAGPIADFDRDGASEPLAAELDALVGQQVTLQVRPEDDADTDEDGLEDADVYTVNDLQLRDPAGPAPWSAR